MFAENRGEIVPSLPPIFVYVDFPATYFLEPETNTHKYFTEQYTFCLCWIALNVLRRNKFVLCSIKVKQELSSTHKLTAKYIKIAHKKTGFIKYKFFRMAILTCYKFMMNIFYSNLAGFSLWPITFVHNRIDGVFRGACQPFGILITSDAIWSNE